MEGRNVRPHIPLGHRKALGSGKAHRHDAPAEQAGVTAEEVKGGEESADGALYRIFDENDEPLVIDLEAIDRCQKLRAFTPFDVAQRDFEDEDLMQLSERRIERGSEWIGKKVFQYSPDSNELIVLIKRGNRAIIPRGNTVIHKNDVMVINKIRKESLQN